MHVLQYALKGFKQKHRKKPSSPLKSGVGGEGRGNVTLLNSSQWKRIDNVAEKLHLAHEVKS